MLVSDLANHICREHEYISAFMKALRRRQVPDTLHTHTNNTAHQ